MSSSRPKEVTTEESDIVKGLAAVVLDREEESAKELLGSSTQPMQQTRKRGYPDLSDASLDPRDFADGQSGCIGQVLLR